jgi:hypothetical protein
LATYSDVITTFLSRKIALIARGGCPPDRWGQGLQVMLEKVAGVTLVNKWENSSYLALAKPALPGQFDLLVSSQSKENASKYFLFVPMSSTK